MWQLFGRGLYVCVCVCVCVCTHMYIYIYVCIYIHTYVYTHTHTYIYMNYPLIFEDDIVDKILIPTFFFCDFLKLILIGLQLLYNVVLASNAQQKESAYLHICPLPFGIPSYPGHYRALSRVPCAVHYVLISCIFKIHKILHFISIKQSYGQVNSCHSLVTA